MSRPADQHLTKEEFETLFPSVLSHDLVVEPPTEVPSDIAAHLARCYNCQTLISKYISFAERLTSFKSAKRSKPERPQEDCPSEDEWLMIAAGLSSPEEAAKEIQHASDCDHCGPLLRMAIEDFASEPSTEDMSLLARLKGNNAAWQHKMAKRMSGLRATPRNESHAADRGWKLIIYPRHLVLAAAGLILVVFAAWRLSNRLEHKQADDLLADDLLATVYYRHRPIELRIQGASHPSFEGVRGDEASQIINDPAFRQAGNMISKGLAKDPSDPDWLQTEGRYQLLLLNYDEAIKYLLHALKIRPDSIPASIDLASSYAGTGNIQEAANVLTKLLGKHSNEAVALFNHALLSEKLNLPIQAIKDWEEYLRIDPSGDWANEARQKRDTLKRSVQGRNQADEPLLSPEELNRTIGSAESDTWTRIDERIEDYLAAAVTSWIPSITETGANGDPSEVDGALKLIADISKRDHGDAWLSVVLAEIRNANSKDAAKALSEAVLANTNGEFQIAYNKALRAQRQFHAGQHPAAYARAALEEVYSLHLLDKADVCLSRIAQLDDRTIPKSFKWIRAQLLLEQSICLNMKGEIGPAKDVASSALELAQRSNYPTLTLRAIGTISVLSKEQGNTDEAWKLCRQGLEAFWNSKVSKMVGYNFYANMDSMAEQANESALDVIIDQQALSLIASSHDYLLLAEEHHRLAIAAEHAGLKGLAEEEVRTADKFLSRVPDTDIADSYRISAEIESARLESSFGWDNLALARIAGLQNKLSKISNRYVTANYYRTYGELEANLGRLTEAENAMQFAVDAAELQLRSLDSENERLDWAKQMGSVYRSLVDIKLERGDSQGALQVLESYEGAALRRATEIPYVSDLTSLKNNLHLSRNETILVYELLPRGIGVWVLDERGLTARRIKIDPDSFRRLADRFSDLCRDPSSSIEATRTVGQQIYSLLIFPINDLLQTRSTLLIEAADSSIFTIPFQALVDSEGIFLSERHPIVYSPGLSYLFALKRSSSKSALSSPLIVASPSTNFGGKELGTLIDVDREASDIAEHLPSARVLLERDVTLSAVRAGLQTATLFHFAGHAVHDRQAFGLLVEDSSLTAPGLVDASMLNKLQFPNLQLAVLAACDTEYNSQGPPQEWQSLVRAFLRAGVPHVVASRWSVDSGRTRALMHGFYTELASGKEVGQALSVAQLALRKASSSERPYDWAGFDAFGKN